MAGRGVHPTPYAAVCDIFAWLTDGGGRRWHLFDGWCAARGVDPLELTTPRFFDLVHFYLRQIVEKEEDRNRLDEQLTGARTGSLTRVDERGIPMPSWWTEDGDTMSTAQSQAWTLKGWQGR